MDKDRAYTEIQSILGHIKYQTLTYGEQMKLILEVLNSLKEYEYQKGFKNGIIQCRNNIDKLLNENRTEPK